MDLSVVLVNWNTRDLLRACLASLRTALADVTGGSEVIVVDNASTDGSAAMVAAEFPEVRLVANQENRNYAAGNNQGLAAARGRWVLLLNPDTEVPRGAPGALIQCLEEHSQAAAVAPALTYPDGRLQESVRGFPGPQALLGELTGLARCVPHSPWGTYRAAQPPQDRVSEVDQPMTSALLFRRSALDQVGHFDEDFPLFFNDVDLCFRLQLAGWRILYDPRIRVVHHGGASTRQVRPEAIRLSHLGLQRFYARHYRSRLAAPAYRLIQAAIALSGWLRVLHATLRNRTH